MPKDSTENMILAELRLLNKSISAFTAVMSQQESEWVRTKVALHILRRGNGHVLKYVREHFMKPEEFRRDGLYWEYSAAALKRIRAMADADKINLPTQ